MATMVDTVPGPKPAASQGDRQVQSTFDFSINIVAYVVLSAVAVIMFIPFIFSVSTSLKTQAEANKPLSLRGLFWPRDITWDAYSKVFDANIDRWFLNSLLVAVIWVIARAVTASMAGYAFARMQFFGRNVIFLLVLMTMMVPGMVTIVPKFLILRQLHLINTYGALTIPFM
ncbi:MAG TPA: carbohydrate ABC transporter permease, partial [Thermomicrobiales bacterium]|nr:carbohydrate ABC transporter permease [Thermomicrobiales bacterium]